MSLFIQSAHAADPAPAGFSIWGNLAMMGVFVAVFYFMIWRPQSKRQNEHKNMLASIKEGSEVMFAGGLLGKIQNISDEYVVINLNERNSVTVQKASIITVLPAGTIDGVKNS